MNFLQRAFARPTPVVDEKYDQAMTLAEEVRDTLRETAEDPYTVIALDLWRSGIKDRVDTALLADAYEAQQEARIFRGDQAQLPKET